MLAPEETVSDYALFQQFKQFIRNHRAEVVAAASLENYVHSHRPKLHILGHTECIPARYKRVLRQLTPDDFKALEQQLHD